MIYEIHADLQLNRINHEPSNPLLYTNRAMSLLKLSLWDGVITDSQQAISLSPNSMKAYYYLAQAEISLHRTTEALQSSKQAHALCVSDIETGAGKNPQGSLGPITELVLRCKKEDWERREKDRLRGRNLLLEELLADLRLKKEAAIGELRGGGAGSAELEDVYNEYDGKIEMLEKTFEAAEQAGSESKKRKVPDWVLDDISFSVMLDPVVVSPNSLIYWKQKLLELKNHADPVNRQKRVNHTTGLR